MKKLLSLCLGLLLAGCATAQSTRILTQQDSGCAVAVSVGTIIVVRLPANPTTGYDWKPVSVTAPVLTLIGLSYAAPRGVVGAGGTDTFRFRATKTGQQRLQLNYARPWETGVPPVQTVSFMVTVTVGRRG